MGVAGPMEKCLEDVQLDMQLFRLVNTLVRRGQEADEEDHRRAPERFQKMGISHEVVEGYAPGELLGIYRADHGGYVDQLDGFLIVLVRLLRLESIVLLLISATLFTRLTHLLDGLDNPINTERVSQVDQVSQLLERQPNQGDSPRPNEQQHLGGDLPRISLDLDGSGRRNLEE